MRKIRRLASLLLVLTMMLGSINVFGAQTAMHSVNDPRLEQFNQYFDEWGVLENEYQISKAYGIKDGIKVILTWDKYTNTIQQEAFVIPGPSEISKAIGNDEIIEVLNRELTFSFGEDGSYDKTMFQVDQDEILHPSARLVAVYPIIVLLGEILFNALLTTAVIIAIYDGLTDTDEPTYYIDASHSDAKAMVKSARKDKCPYFYAQLLNDKTWIGPQFQNTSDAINHLRGSDKNLNNIFSYSKSLALTAATSAGSGTAIGPENHGDGPFDMDYFDHYHPYNPMYANGHSPGHSFYHY